MVEGIKKDFENHWELSDCDFASEQKKRMALSFLKPILKVINQSDKVISLLDAGCGDGIHAIVLAENISNIHFKYIGLDISKKAVEKCKSRIGHDDRFSFKVMDLEDFEVGETFDIIISYGVVAYARFPQKVISNIVKHLKPHGKFLLWIYAPSIISRISLQFVRFFTTRVNEKILIKIVDLIVHLMTILPVSSGVNLRNSSIEQCRETVLVNIRPQVLHLPSQHTLNDWIKNTSLKSIDKNIYMRLDK